MNKDTHILTQAYNSLIHGDFKKGIYLIEGYLRVYKSSESIYINLGAAYMKLEDYKEAKKNFDKALEFGNYLNSIHYNLAKYYLGVANKYKKDNPAFAISQLKKH